MHDPFERHLAHIHAEAFGRRIHRARRARGWSQEELARQAGMAQSTISRLENGLAPWTPLVRGLHLLHVLEDPVDDGER